MLNIIRTIETLFRIFAFNNIIFRLNVIFSVDIFVIIPLKKKEFSFSFNGIHPARAEEVIDLNTVLTIIKYTKK